MLDAWDCPKRNDVVILPHVPPSPSFSADTTTQVIQCSAMILMTTACPAWSQLANTIPRRLDGVGLLAGFALDLGSDERK